MSSQHPPRLPETRRRTNNAPALTKGLDILEALAIAPSAMTLSQISATLGRSVAEIFRMVRVLGARGYISTAGATGKMELTRKLFTLRAGYPPHQELLSNALPVMERLAAKTGLSCHLAIQWAEHVIVVARAEPPLGMSFSFRVGFRETIGQSAAGVIFYGFASPAARLTIRDALSECDPAQFHDFETYAGRAARQGFFIKRQKYAIDITETCCPVKRGRSVIATLSLVSHVNGEAEIQSNVKHVIESAALISRFLRRL